MEDGPRQALAAQLRELHLEVGRPSVTRLVALTSALGNRIPRSTIQDKLRGKSAPTFDQLLTIVRACLRHATEHDIAVAGISRNSAGAATGTSHRTTVVGPA